MHRTVINAGVDIELDELKRRYDGLEDLLTQTSRQVASTVPAVYDLELNVIFFPQIGFLIAIPINPTTGRGDYEGGEMEEQHWEHIFSTGQRVYYKDNRMRELDAGIGDIYAVICGMLSLILFIIVIESNDTLYADKEIEIVHELGQQALAHEELLNTASDICGELDRYVCYTRPMTRE